MVFSRLSDPDRDRHVSSACASFAVLVVVIFVVLVDEDGLDDLDVLLGRPALRTAEPRRSGCRGRRSR